MAWTPFTRLDHDRSRLRYTSDMTRAEYRRIAPCLPGQPKRGRKRRVCLRSVINAIFYVLQNGCAWANLPKDFPPKSTVSATQSAVSSTDKRGFCHPKASFFRPQLSSAQKRGFFRSKARFLPPQSTVSSTQKRGFFR